MQVGCIAMMHVLHFEHGPMFAQVGFVGIHAHTRHGGASRALLFLRAVLCGEHYGGRVMIGDRGEQNPDKEQRSDTDGGIGQKLTDCLASKHTTSFLKN
jgi:hypothetical protein